jgi:hypothetical protein
VAASVALVKRKLRKPPESWHWRLPKKPGRDSALDPLHLLEAGATVKIVGDKGLLDAYPRNPSRTRRCSHAVLMIPGALDGRRRPSYLAPALSEIVPAGGLLQTRAAPHQR